MLYIVKLFLKKALYYSGILSYLHKKDNAQTLTVVLFHRVLPVSDIRWKQADMDWTVSDVFYEDCLVFFKKHYNLITEQDILNKNEKPLPERALLVTFDDGWADNYEYALPINQKHSINPLLFVTTGAMGKKILNWQEVFYSAWRIDLITDEIKKQLELILKGGAIKLDTESEIKGLISSLQSLDEPAEVLKEITSSLLKNIPCNTQMLSLEQLVKMFKGGVSMGTHGVVHEPLTQAINPMKDMSESRSQLMHFLENEKILTMSFPHGKLNERLISMAFKEGYRFLFGSKPCVNIATQSKSGTFGRLNIEQADLENSIGKLSPEKMALYLFRQKIA